MTTIISNPEDQKKIKNALEEISKSYIRMDSERALIKDIVEDLHEAFKDVLTKKQINRMAKTYHKGTFKKDAAQQDEFEILYENITGEKLDSE